MVVRVGVSLLAGNRALGYCLIRRSIIFVMLTMRSMMRSKHFNCVHACKLQRKWMAWHGMFFRDVGMRHIRLRVCEHHVQKLSLKNLHVNNRGNRKGSHIAPVN